MIKCCKQEGVCPYCSYSGSDSVLVTTVVGELSVNHVIKCKCGETYAVPYLLVFDDHRIDEDLGFNIVINADIPKNVVHMISEKEHIKLINLGEALENL